MRHQADRGRPRHARRISPAALAIVAVTQLLLGVAFQSTSQALTLCNFPGHAAWSLEDGTPIQTAVWFDEVEIIDVHSNPPTITPATGSVIATAAGNIIRTELYACSSVIQSADSMSGIYRFRDRAYTQPNWNARDKVAFDAQHLNIGVSVGVYFQQVGVNSNYLITPILAHYDSTKSVGPSIAVTDTPGTVPAADIRGPANGGSCGTLAPGKYEAQIAQDGNVDEGVWDNLKGGGIKNLTYMAATHRIRVELMQPKQKQTASFKVGDPVKISGAGQAAYNGDWRVTDVQDPLHFTTTGPNVLLLDRSHGGTAIRYYSSGDAIPRGTQLSGYVEICVGTPGLYYATEKFEPTPSVPAMKTVRWESESKVPGPLAANTIFQERWYQTMPCDETGDLKMWPRVVMTPGLGPDQNVLAEGPAFVFHITDAAGDPFRCD
ncbi:MAG TPA: hypothetical protein VKA30_10835 [Actinomycetota bacterium]|nr:hypothetical protein [Actinomycetota bacterium]